MCLAFREDENGRSEYSWKKLGIDNPKSKPAVRGPVGIDLRVPRRYLTRTHFHCPFMTNPLPAGTRATGSSQPWRPESMILLKRVGGTALSPDGKTAAYTVTVPVDDQRSSRFESGIWIASTDGKQNTRITSGGLSCSDPAFSPDGTTLAFLAAESEGKKQIWLTSPAGGDVVKLTDTAGGVVAFRWSPDGRSVGFTTPDVVAGDGDSPVRNALVADAKSSSAHIHVAEPGTGMRGPGSSRRLTQGGFHVTSFDWSPDGTRIVFAHQATPSPDAIATNDISLLDVGTGTVTLLVSGRGADVTPFFSPDGRWIAFASDGGEPHWAHTMDISVIAPEGGEPKKLSRTPGRYATLLGWNPDGGGVYVLELDRTSNRVFALPLDGSPPRAITIGDGTFSVPAFGRKSSMICFIHERSDVPPEVYASDVGNFTPKRLSCAAADFERLTCARTEVIRWRSAGGPEVEGILTYPLHHSKGKRFPLIVQLHGGPASAFQQWYTGAPSVYPVQAFAEAGFGMLCPNPRGSDGYGKEFRYANLSDWGGGDREDVLAGVDHLVAEGLADPGRLGVCGWSYGGYLSALLVGSTQRFKAASVGGGIVHIASFAGTTDIPGYVRDYFGGEFWERPALYTERSPLFLAGSIAAPTQILHGGVDERVPPSQGRELYTALKRRGIPVEFILYPGMPHAASDPETIIDIGRRVVAWFVTHIPV